MAATGSLVLGGLGLGSSLYSGQTQAQAIQFDNAIKKQQTEFNQKLAEIQAEDIIFQGEKDIKYIKKQAKQFVGEQRAALAGQGIEVDTGTARILQEDTYRQAELDAITRKTNAWREAWGVKFDAFATGQAASFRSIASEQTARQSIISGGLQGLQYGLQGYQGYLKNS